MTAFDNVLNRYLLNGFSSNNCQKASIIVSFVFFISLPHLPHYNKKEIVDEQFLLNEY